MISNKTGGKKRTQKKKKKKIRRVVPEGEEFENTDFF